MTRRARATGVVDASRYRPGRGPSVLAPSDPPSRPRLGRAPKIGSRSRIAGPSRPVSFRRRDRLVRERGFQLLEVSVVVTILGLSAAWALPRLDRWSSGVRVRLAADECLTAMRKARALAISRGERVGLKFRIEGDRYSYTLHRDGDGDGLLTADIESGTDPALAPMRQLAHLGADVRFGFPEGIVPTDPSNPGTPLDNLDDPIRFNLSDIASFSSLGESTPGSLYITGGGHLVAVRVFNRTGKVKIIRYFRDEEIWKDWG